MNEDTLTVVHCYAGDQERVERMLPYWLHHETPILLLSPEDAPVEIKHERITCRSAGKAGWKGARTILRQIAHWKITSEFPQTHLFLNDSDTVCLTPELPNYLNDDSIDLWANVIGTRHPTIPAYGMNFEPPYYLNQWTLARLIDFADHLPEEYRGYVTTDVETVEISAFYMTASELLGLRSQRFNDGFRTYPSIEDWAPWVYWEAQNVGARVIHGIKQVETADRLADCYRSWARYSVSEELVDTRKMTRVRE